MWRGFSTYFSIYTSPTPKAASASRWAVFRANRRGYWSLWLFLALYALSLGSELIANKALQTGKVDAYP